jgi:phage-related protein
VDQQGLLEEDAGRATALQTQNAQDATNTLKSQVASTKQNLLGQVTAAESVAPPIAGVNDQAVTAGLDTTRQAISGVTNTSGDVIASLGGVPTVSPLTNIFTNVLGGVGSYVGGQNALGISNSYANSRSAGLGGTNPNRSSTGP